jgi:hypothetical protein
MRGTHHARADQSPTAGKVTENRIQSFTIGSLRRWDHPVPGRPTAYRGEFDPKLQAFIGLIN